MKRIARILGKSASASIVFSAQKRLQFVEVTIQARLHTIVAEGKAGTMQSALHKAIEHAENQALRHRDRRMAIKRKPKREKTLTAIPVARPKARRLQPVADAAEEKSVRAGAKARAAIAIARKAVSEPHILPSGEAFHNPSGDLFVLHRRRDGQMELVEIP
jgi:putative sigma-54 modulation protein